MFDDKFTVLIDRTGNCRPSSSRKQGAGMNWVARASRAAVCLFVSALALCSAPSAQYARAADPIVKRGDAAVTAFAGTRTDKDVPADVHPLDRTFIDLDGSAMQLFDLSALGTAPRAALADAPAKLQIKARDTGQVFGVAFDDANGGTSPNIYVTATSLFGLQIVKANTSGGFDRLLQGQPGARWMPGQFATDKGGTPGAIYKIDGLTGAVSLFANVKTDGRDNAGPGLGNIAFDARTRQLFVTDLETGLIHRITLEGQDRDVFDHGETARKAQGLDAVSYDSTQRMSIESPSFNVEDPATWGMADERRRPFAVAVVNGRLYYSLAEGPAVWSVSIDDEGDFGNDPRIELQPAGTPAGTAITGIAFDGAGMMYLAQRGTATGSYDYTAFAAPAQARVLRYRWDEKAGRWAEQPQEYAIGLSGEYRNTQGGVALNYGYDKNGNIDYGQCRQTLWTTGEHLREGQDVARVSLGGAKIVNGLQGNYKSRVRPQNEPPYESWFVDYDGAFDDADAYGQIGAVAIFAPCEPAPARAGEPLVTPQIIGLDPPADDPGLVLDKKCHAGAIGGKIRCTITVRNVSDHVPVADVKITDATTILAGPGAGGLVPIAAVSVPLPAIACAAAPASDFWCTIPAALLPPGEVIGIDVWVETHDLALAGNFGFRNCARLHHPDGYAKACAEGGTDIVVEKIGPDTCLPGATCKFGLRIANSGLMPFDGDVLLADAMFVGGAVKNAVVTAVNPPVACSAGDMNQLPFTCLAHLSLMPGEEHTHWVDVTMPAPGGYWAQNCFGALDPTLVPVGPVPPGFGGGGDNPSCVWVDVPAPKENLKITKTGADALGKCDKVGANLQCKYDVAITNENTIAFNDTLKFEEKLPAGATLVGSGPVWSCAGGPPTYTCDTGGPVAIPAGGSVNVPITVSIPVPAVEALSCSVPNAVKLTVPAAGAPGNLNGADDTANATEWTWGLSWEDPVTHVTHVVCDPTNLKVEKKAKGPCKAQGGDFACSWDVIVTNAGPDPYKGPLKLTEKFGPAPADVTFSAPFSCTGSGETFACETPVVELAKGDSLTLEVTAKVADDGTCRVANTASLTFPAAGSKGNGDGSDDTASATASVPSQRCTKPSREPPVTLIPLPRCPDGRLVRADGSCPCPQGRAWDVDRQRCDEREPRCYDPERRRDDGSCCPHGTVYDDETDRCRRPHSVCADPERLRDDGSCCPIGTVVSENGERCVSTESVCPLDMRWNYIAETCVPVRPMCAHGERYDWRRRECRPIYEQCPPGTRFSRETRRCEPIVITCPIGQKWNPIRLRCERDEVGGNCPDGSSYLADRTCRCPLNMRWSRKMQMCQRIDLTGPTGPLGNCPLSLRKADGSCTGGGMGAGPGGTVPCPKGQRRVGRICVPDRVPGSSGQTDTPQQPLPGCPTGQHRVGKICVPDRIVTPPAKIVPKLPDVPAACPAGRHRVGGTCVPDRIEPKIEPRKEPKTVPKIEPKTVPKFEPKTRLKFEPKPVPKPAPKFEPPKRGRHDAPDVKIKKFEPQQRHIPQFNKGGGKPGQGKRFAPGQQKGFQIN